MSIYSQEILNQNVEMKRNGIFYIYFLDTDVSSISNLKYDIYIIFTRIIHYYKKNNNTDFICYI